MVVVSSTQYIIIELLLMQSLRSYPIQINSQSTIIGHFPTAHKRNLSPKQQKDQLIKKIEIISSKNNALEQKQDSLQSTISDIRKLLQFVGKEAYEETYYLHSQNKVLETKVDRLTKALKYSHRDGNHLNKCAMFWGQFLQ